MNLAELVATGFYQRQIRFCFLEPRCDFFVIASLKLDESLDHLAELLFNRRKIYAAGLRFGAQSRGGNADEFLKLLLARLQHLDLGPVARADRVVFRFSERLPLTIIT